MSARRTVIAVLVAVGLLVGVVATAYVRRIRPPWPAVAGDPYPIALAADGCPIMPEQVQFVDAPGPLVPSDPTEVVLCTIPTGLVTGRTRIDSTKPHLVDVFLQRYGAQR